MRIASTFSIVLAIFLTCISPAPASVFTVDQWSVGAGVQGVFPYGSGWSFQTVTNPFVDSVQVYDRESSSAAGFNFSWDEEYGNFLSLGSQHCEAQNLPPFPGGAATEHCSSGGSIYFTATADLLVTVDASYNYNLTGPNLYTDLVVGASIVEGELWPEVFSINRVADTFVSYPAAGTFSISHQATLLAGHQYLIGYSMRILALGNTGAVGTGDGYVHFTLTPVPEPSAILPLALATMLLRRRRS